MTPCTAPRFPEWYACCPPMRSAETVAALKERLADGAIHTVSSDHSCYDLSQKRERTDDVRAMPHGLPGVETRMPVTFTADGVRRRPVEDFVEVFSAGPARINAVPGKGTIAEGFDADLVIFDPAEERAVDGGALHMGTDFSPVRRAGTHRLARRRGLRRPGGAGRRTASTIPAPWAVSSPGTASASISPPHGLPPPHSCRRYS